MKKEGCHKKGGKWNTRNKTCNWVDIYYDNELVPPSWGARKVKQLSDNSLIITDFECGSNKKDAIKIGKKMAKKHKLNLLKE